MTYDEARQAALHDYTAALGKTLRPDWVVGYVESHSIDVATDRKVSVRVVATDMRDLAHDTGGFLDPYWNIEVVSDPEGRTSGMRSLWMFGPAKEYQS